ncbi:TPA: DUF4276 family protein [Proteus mirabilis]|uniref:DUF4276 family protein n=1 Tax=Proteus mirabilis TaxID=584 RepID=UPI000B49AAD8|nr:DUF4276 family protein [Proteus mirabilis]ASB01744.1 hypothetical protein AM403_08735 [Proteus mirabilis]EKV9647500.1 DUF4276 family protein [Proteus mirabilis]ELA8986529.1 DUF4276 family protein [Proteus mirabilis]MBI6354282.1 DUF4276 family protein [Proteus mirabilis]MDU3453785.1 DUF4276 family protein [Proteus mirabilis]
MSENLANHYIEVIAIVEGKTEQVFIESILAPYLAAKNIFIRTTQVSKPGQKGGDVKFSRTIKDIGNHLKQRANTFVCTFIDYYGVKEWPGVGQVPKAATPKQIAEIVNLASQNAVAKYYPELQTTRRYIPYLAVHEFEALLFSDVEILATKMGVNELEIQQVLNDCGEPEAINNSPTTAPSKRLDGWSNGNFKKTSTGIAIAREIGVSAMREKCPVFNAWLDKVEHLVGVNHEA